MSASAEHSRTAWRKMWTAAGWCVLSLAAVAGTPLTTRAGSTVSGQHVCVICDFDDDTAAREALVVAEAAWNVAAKLLGVAPTKSGAPREVHLYETIAAYERVDAEMNAGQFQANLAFAHPRNTTAHIVVQPPLSPELRKQIGLTALTKRLIAHETTHLVRYTTFPNHPSHPEWFADGIAMLVQQIVVGRLGAGGDPQDDPEWSTKNARAQRLLNAKQLPAIHELLSDAGNNLERLDRYAARGLAVQFLATGDNRPRFDRIVAEARKLGGGNEYAEQLRRLVEREFDDSQLERLNDVFTKYVAAQRAPYNEVHRSLEIRKDGYVQVAHADTNALLWVAEPVKADPYRLTGQLEFLPATHAQMNVLLARSADGSFVSVAFTAGYGIDVFDYDAPKNNWNRVGTAQVGDIQLGMPVRYAIHAETGRIVVEVNAKECLTAELPNRRMTGQGGFGVQAGAAGRWSDVRIAADRIEAPRP